jgi:hypothetical protein
VFFQDGAAELRSLPASWTSVVGVDPFVAVSAGRARFRVEDLLEFCRLVQRLEGDQAAADV